MGHVHGRIEWPMLITVNIDPSYDYGDTTFNFALIQKQGSGYGLALSQYNTMAWISYK